MPYTVRHVVEDGIERVTYTPRERRFATPILFQHGMWHGAWCWQPWQELLAEWGWESHAHSLPGHGRSPEQRPLRWCTLQYYYEFLNQEILRQERPTVLVGHSMGGALTQWYLKYGRPLPAAILVASWPSHDMLTRTLGETQWRLDPLGNLLCLATLSANPMVRTPQRAAACFITEGALLSPAELHARLSPESLLVILQYTSPLWQPAAPEAIRSPLLWIAGGADAVIPERVQRLSAHYYGAGYQVVSGAGHDVMLERSSAQSARSLHEWLAKQVA
jgi:pimeloyl-ACP methyl ester carboxylesterase